MKTPEILYEGCQGHPWLDSPCLQTFDWVNFTNDYLIVRQPIVFSSVLYINGREQQCSISQNLATRFW